MFNKSKIEDLNSQISELRKQNERLSSITAMEAAELEVHLERLKLESLAMSRQLEVGNAQLEEVKGRIVATEDAMILQEVGVYMFEHVLDSAVAYEDRLKNLHSKIKEFNRANGSAVTGSSAWTVNGSKSSGERMVKEVSKLMLRAYNGEVDDAVRTLKPYKIDAAIDRLNKVHASIEKLGKSMTIAISPEYHDIRLQELRLTADFLQKEAEEKEAQKAERERLREEAKAQKEYQTEKARLLKEQSHYENLLRQAIETGNANAEADAREKLENTAEAIAGVDERSANIRAGYVYVISNIGSFGSDVVKIGLTRRLDYRDRIRELGDASVPFIFDTHAVVFSDDAVSLEKRLHDEMSHLRINQVNQRKEFFRMSPGAVKELLEQLAGEHLLIYKEDAEAVEWRMSQSGELTIPEQAQFIEEGEQDDE